MERNTRPEDSTQPGGSRQSPQSSRESPQSPRDPREESGSRWALWRRVKSAISSEHPAIPTPTSPSPAPATSSASSTASSALSPASSYPGAHAREHLLDHARARQLLLAQHTALLPPTEANALSTHLLTCDSCYRFAQDLAASRRHT